LKTYRCLIKRDQKNKGKGKQRQSEIRDDSDEEAEGEISDDMDSDKMAVDGDAEDERGDSKKTTKPEVCLSWRCCHVTKHSHIGKQRERRN
jgi:hypothetical protein